MTRRQFVTLVLFAPRLVVVPDCFGLDIQHAKARIFAAGLQLGRVREVPGDARPRWSVIAQSPKAGTTVSPSASVSFDVASGSGRQA